eukprot:13346429-Ditylum_brightwellii.AAC.1
MPCKALIQVQSKIGWEQLRYGRWSYEWENLQHRYLILVNQQDTSNAAYPVWAGQILRENWML